MNIKTATIRQLVDFHNSFSKALPDLKPVTITQFKSKVKLVERLEVERILRPAAIATVLDITPFIARQKLREAVAAGSLPHQKDKRWFLTMAEFAAVFIAAEASKEEEVQ